MMGNQMPSENSNLFSNSTDLPPERILEVQSLRKHFPIRKGFIKKTVEIGRAHV